MIRGGLHAGEIEIMEPWAKTAHPALNFISVFV
jgi:hypothetical protein